MASRRSVAGLVFALTAGIAAVTAQDALTTIGRFVDLDGKPVAGAKITFATSPVRVFDAFAPTTLVTSETDAEGRYRVSLHTGRAYSAWAIGPDDAIGRARSAVREGVVAGNVVDFVAATRADEMRTLQFPTEDLAALKIPVLFAVVRIDAQHHRPLRLPIRKDGTVALPPLPHANLQVHLTDAADAVVVPRVIAYGGNGAFAEAQSRHFVVRDERGAPIPDAIVITSELDFFGRGAEPFGTLRVEANTLRSQPTDENGRTTLRVHKGPCLFVASAPGFAAAATGTQNGIWFQDGKWTDAALPAADAEVTFTLHPAPALRGRLHHGDRALPELGVELATELRFERNEGGGSQSISLDHAETTRTSADGVFAFASVPQNASGLQLAIQPPAVDAPPVIFLPREVAPAAPLDIDLATWPVVTFRGTDCKGGPAGDLRVVLLPGHSPLPSPDPVSLPADRAGRVRAQLEPGSWFVFATDGDGAWTELVTIAPGAATEIALQLAPLARITGTLQGQDGRPLADVGFSFGGTQSTPPLGASPHELLLRQHAMLLARGLTARVRTDAQGRFELRYYPVPGVTLIGSPSGHHDCRVELRVGAPEELELHSRQ